MPDEVVADFIRYRTEKRQQSEQQLAALFEPKPTKPLARRRIVSNLTKQTAETLRRVVVSSGAE
jgi:hypothetical protein